MLWILIRKGIAWFYWWSAAPVMVIAIDPTSTTKSLRRCFVIKMSYLEQTSKSFHLTALALDRWYLYCPHARADLALGSEYAGRAASENDRTIRSVSESNCIYWSSFLRKVRRRKKILLDIILLSFSSSSSSSSSSIGIPARTGLTFSVLSCTYFALLSF